MVRTAFYSVLNNIIVKSAFFTNLLICLFIYVSVKVILLLSINIYGVNLKENLVHYSSSLNICIVKYIIRTAFYTVLIIIIKSALFTNLLMCLFAYVSVYMYIYNG